MSRLIAAAAIRGAHKVVERAEQRLNETIEAKGKDLTLKGQNIKIEAMMGLDMTAKGGNAKIEGLETTVKGSLKMGLDGGAMMEIKGALVKIN